MIHVALEPEDAEYLLRITGLWPEDKRIAAATQKALKLC